MTEENKDIKPKEGSEESKESQVGSAFTELNPDNLSEELQTIYKSMQADYTRKTQSLADDRKTFTEKEAGIRTEYDEKLKTYGSMEQEVTQWRNWYSNQQTEEKPGESDTTGTGMDYEKEPGEKGYTEAMAKIKGLEDQLTQVVDGQKRSSEEVGRMFKYQDELNDLKSEHSELDKGKVIEHMLARGITDPKVAYTELYQDDIIERQVQERLEVKLAELEQKRQADVLKGPGRVLKSQVFKPPKDMKPRDWEETEQEVIHEHLSKEMGLT